MTDELMIFNNPEFGDIRTVTIDDEPWFVGKDVATALGYSNPRDALARHVDDEDRNTVANPDGNRGNPNMTIINESGLYALILSSKLPAAKKFKRWVTSEILPALRKTGKYIINPPSAPLEKLTPRALTTDDYLKAASIVATCRNERLPYVMHYLAQGGFEPPAISAKDNLASNIQSEALHLMWDAKAIYGLSNAQIARILGIDRVQTGRYINGQGKPNPQRATIFAERLKNAFAQIKEASSQTAT